MDLPLIPPAAAATSRPYSGRTGRLPRHLHELGAPWLTRLLQHRYPGIAVRGYTVVEVKNSHTTKLRLRLDLNEVGVAAGIPAAVCLKSNWSEGFESGDICELEARFYALMGGHLQAPVARSWYADWDADSHLAGGGCGIVMMEDLGVADGQFGHSSGQLGVDGVVKGLESLAALHGALWGSPQGAAMGWLPTSMDTAIDTEQLRRNYLYIARNLAQPAYQAVLPRWVHETPERFAHAFDELAHSTRSQRGPRGLVHGDAHQGNSFLRGNGQRIWHDWQLGRQGQPWRDVSYFMLGALTVQERRASAEHLVSHYREALLATGARDVPDFDTAWQHFRRWPVYDLQAWLGNVDSWGQGGLPMVERFAAAAEDFDTLGLLTAGKPPRRPVRLGEGARPLTAALLQADEAKRDPPP